jgi:putative MATE family efflux protein
MLKSGGRMRKFRVYGHENKKDYTDGPMLGNIILFMLPVMFTGIIQLLYNAADMVVVGNWSDNATAAVAAVGACGALINLIVNLFMGLSVGAGVVVAQRIGANDHDGVRKVVHTAILTSIFTGIAVGLFGFFMAKPLLILMGTNDDVLAEAAPYMSAYFVGIPASMVYNHAASILRSKGDSKNPLIFLTLSGLSNVFLNLIFVCVFHMGAVGVGIATAVSQYVAMAMVLYHMTKLEDDCRLDFKALAIDKDSLKRMMRIGLPAGLQGTFFSLSNVLIQSTVNTYPTEVMAGNTTAGNIEGFIYISMNACYHAALTFVGQNTGAKKYDRVLRASLICLGLVTIIGLGMGIPIGFEGFGIGKSLLGIYRPGEELVHAAGIRRLQVIALTYFLCGIMDVGSGIMRGMGKSFLPMMVSLIGSCVFRIVWIQLLCPGYPESIQTLYISYPISWILTAGVHLICCVVTWIMRVRKLKQEQSLARSEPEPVT